MRQYIPKDAVIAEINKRIMEAPIDCYGHQRVWAYNDVKNILNNLEVQDVDLKKEVDSYRSTFYWDEDLYKFAKHFFELGMQQSKNDNNKI